MNIYIIDEAIDKMGGVERIMNTLANNFSKNNQVHIISLFKTCKTEFFKYDKEVNIKYIFDTTKSKEYKNKILAKLNNIIRHLIVRVRLKEYSKIIQSDDAVIIGRVRVAWKYVELFKKSKKVIVRDAIHIMSCKWYEKIMMKWKFPKYINKFIVSSDESKRTYEKFFNNSIKIVKIYNPLGIEASNKYSLDNKVVLAVGRSDSQKAYEVLIKSFKLVTEKISDWRLKIVGEVKNDEKILLLIKKLELEDNIILVNPTQNIVKELSKAGLYVMTSRYEGYANSLVEAVACGVPSITFNWLMGAEEIVENNVNGIVVPLQDRIKYFYGKDSNDDIKNLADTIVKLINNSTLRLRMSQSSEKIVESRQTQYIVNKWYELIDN